MNPTIVQIILGLLSNTPYRKFFFPKYLTSFTAPQLCFLCRCIEDTKDVEGAIAEIGCYWGHATVFLNNYMDAQNIHKTYYAIDTFSGFVSEDIEFEIANRGKQKDLFAIFENNNKKWFDITMKENNINRVHSIEADVNKFDLRTLSPLSFALLDVDLYKPTKKSLNELYTVLNPGGIIVVDDCDSSDMRWDGSDQAYKEFMKERNQSTQIILGKLGIIRKDA